MSDTLRQQIGEILDRAETELVRTVSERQVRPFTREALDRELVAARDTVLRMGNAVEEAIANAVTSLVQGDSEVAQRVIDGDLRINEMQREASVMITMIIATQQPVARDLRFLLALDHVAYELERIGDHARSIARHSQKLAGIDLLRPYITLPEMGRLAADLLHEILRALVAVDEQRAREIAALDDDIDVRYHDVFDRLLELMRADSANVEPGSRLLLVAHDLERIGDRVTNVAEDVVFLARGAIEDLNP